MGAFFVEDAAGGGTLSADAPLNAWFLTGPCLEPQDRVLDKTCDVQIDGSTVTILASVTLQFRYDPCWSVGTCDGGIDVSCEVPPLAEGTYALGFEGCEPIGQLVVPGPSVMWPGYDGDGC